MLLCISRSVANSSSFCDFSIGLCMLCRLAKTSRIEDREVHSFRTPNHGSSRLANSAQCSPLTPKYLAPSNYYVLEHYSVQTSKNLSRVTRGGQAPGYVFREPCPSSTVLSTSEFVHYYHVRSIMEANHHHLMEVHAAHPVFFAFSFSFSFFSNGGAN